jgi:hypothetical protein
MFVIHGNEDDMLSMVTETCATSTGSSALVTWCSGESYERRATISSLRNTETDFSDVRNGGVAELKGDIFCQERLGAYVPSFVAGATTTLLAEAKICCPCVAPDAYRPDSDNNSVVLRRQMGPERGSPVWYHADRRT